MGESQHAPIVDTGMSRTQVRDNDGLQFKTREAVREKQVHSQREEEERREEEVGSERGLAGASLSLVAKISPATLDMESVPIAAGSVFRARVVGVQGEPDGTQVSNVRALPFCTQCRV